MQQVMDRERHRQQVELLKQQNKQTEERIAYLKDMERKLKQLVVEWRKTEDKGKVVKEMSALLFPKDEKKVASKKQKQLNSKYEEINGEIKIGDKVKMKRNLQELVSFVFRECSFPFGCLVMTGTGIVPGHDFTLQSGDIIYISIEHIGTLINTVE